MGTSTALLSLTLICGSLALSHGASLNWRTGRATFYGASQAISAAFDPTRGAGSFGVLPGGCCGFTNEPSNTIPFPQDSVAAAASANFDYDGSCGRCYDVRCVSGPVKGNNGQPLSIKGGTFSNGAGPYLPSINSTVKDTFGRSFPGNPDLSQNLDYVKCWNESYVQRVRIIDCCPCQQFLQAGAPGVSKTQTRTQPWCCGGSAGYDHFDLSFYAFEKLAHPLYGAMMLQYAPVDCDTGAPIPEKYISKDVIYSGETKPGWKWMTYSAHSQQYAVSAGAPTGKAATCVEVAPSGGLQFTCEDCNATGLQPFAGATGVSFWIKSNSNNSSPYFSSTLPGQVPNLKLYIDDPFTNSFCGNSPYTGTLKPAQRKGNWYQFVIPISTFKCNSLPDKTQFAFENDNKLNAYFCLADVTIQHG